jgi:hypothetical protein
MALPITAGSVYYPGIKIHETRIIRLLDVLLHAGNNLGGWSARQISRASKFPKRPTVSTNFATTCANSKAKTGFFVLALGEQSITRQQ